MESTRLGDWPFMTNGWTPIWITGEVILREEGRNGYISI